MIKYFICAVFSLLLIGCSGQKEITSSDNNTDIKATEASSVENDSTSIDLTDDAMNHFIDGAINDAKGDFASAILDYQDALSLDPKPGIYYALAKSYFELNKYPRALQDCQKAILLDSTQLEYQDLLADIFTAASQFDSAAAVLEGIVKVDSNRVQSYYKLARIYENSKPLQAIKIYNKLTSILGPDWNVLIRVAELNEKLGRTDESADALKNLLTIDPSNVTVQKLLAQLYLKAKRYDEALKVVNDIIQFTPEDAGARQLKAQIYLDQNDWKSAAKEFSFVLNRPDVKFDNKVQIGIMYFNQSLKDSSLIPVTEKFFKDIDKDSTDWQIKLYLGAITYSEGKDSLAEKYFNKVNELARWNSDGWVRLGGIYFDNRKYAEAEKLMSKAIVNFPQNFAINLILGLSMSQQGKYAEAKPLLKKAVDMNPGDLNALSGYGIVLSQLIENKEAAKYLNNAVALAPDNVDLLGTLGLVYNNMHNDAMSDSIYQKALDIDSTNALVNNNFAYSLSERGIRLDDALRMIKIAISADSANSSYLDTMGWVYFKLGKYDLAKVYIEKAIHNGGESSTMLDHLGDVEFKTGNKKHAKVLWEKAYKLDASNADLKSKIEKGAI